MQDKHTRLSASTQTKLDRFQSDEVEDSTEIRDITSYVPRQSIVNISIDNDLNEVGKNAVIPVSDDDDEPSTSEPGFGLKKFAATQSKHSGKTSVNKRTQSKYTPLEQQYIELKEKSQTHCCLWNVDTSTGSLGKMPRFVFYMY